MDAMTGRITDFRMRMGTIVNDHMLQYLITKGYFTAPASSKFHGAYAGGLYDHSVAVANHLVDLSIKLGLTWKRPESPHIIGMFHDLCKIDQYNVSNSKVTVSSNAPLKGHGDKSLIILSSLMQLTIEEAVCIRYHMGAFGDEQEQREYSSAVEAYPNLLWTHTADMIAAKIDNV